MKILQINAVYKTKSTGRIVMELHNYFKRKGIDSFVGYAIENSDNSNDSNIFRIGSTIDHKIHAVKYRINKLQGCHSTKSTKNLINKIKNINPDLILLHNLHSNYLNVPLLFDNLSDMNIPTVVVLHDCWFMTGGCYNYTAQMCSQWQTGCINCEYFGKVAKKKYDINCKIIEKLHPTFIAVSKWLYSEANKSLLASRSNIELIYNWIDLDFFYHRDICNIRKKYNIGDEKVILGVSTVWTKNKGILDIINIAKELKDIKIIIVGKQKEIIEYPDNVIVIPFTDSKDELAELYSLADIFFNPSKQETFGLVTGEALACGTPVIVYNTTACPEFVTTDTGVVINNNTEVVSAINYLLDNIKERGKDYYIKKCREFVEENFNIEKNIEKYINLFKQIIEG